MARALDGVGVIAFLEADPRPTFVAEMRSSLRPAIIYTNPALKALPTLRDIDSATENHEVLWGWIRDASTRPTARGLSHLGKVWSCLRLTDRLLAVSTDVATTTAPEDSKQQRDILGLNGTVVAPASAGASVSPPSASAGQDGRPSLELPRSSSQVDIRGTRRSTTEPEWIVPDLIPEQKPFLEVIRSVDWGGTPLGPISTWHSRLHQTFNQIIADSRPIAIYWGREYTTIYNEAYSRICGCRHPWLLGKAVDAAWPEAGRRLKETMQTSAEKQRASVEDEWRFFIEKTDGNFEETYLKWSIIPILDNKDCLGFMHPVLETTSMKLWERRMNMLIELGEVLVTARDVKSYWGKTIEELEAVEPRYDIPLAILYSVGDDSESSSEVSWIYESNKICHLEGALGVPKGHPIIPAKLDLRQSDEGLSSMFREALRVRYPILLQVGDGSLPASLLDGLQFRGFGDPCTAAVICPIRPTKEENVMGLLFLGLNPRRPYDNDYRQYISLLNQKLTTSLASTVLLEEEARRGRNAAEQAAYDQEVLKERLEVQTKEATESIRRFEAVAEFVPVGMCFGDNNYNGNITFANDAWYRITGYPRQPGGVVAPGGFLSCVVDDDRANIARAYERLQGDRSVTFEFRVKKRDSQNTTVNPSGNSPSYEKAGLDLVGIEALPPERHVLATAKAERAPDGTVIRVLMCLTDVTLHKHTAEAAVRRAQQAENLKRMAEFATVGMYDMDLEGRLLGANHVFYHMCGLEKKDLTTNIVKPWEHCVMEEDMPLLKRSMATMIKDGRAQTAELRFKTPWIDESTGEKVHATRWIEATFMPVKSSDGIIQSFTGCLSDLTLQKLQLERERQRKDEAIESKRQQENFIDMTSHEMRNPLGAIVHCADAVIASLTKVQELGMSRASTPAPDATNRGVPGLTKSDSKDTRAEEDQLIADSIDNAETIVACAQHQRRIVDDILTMSKLDSNLLTITPITVNPVQIVQEALKMFEVEARRVDITLSLVVDKSYANLRVEYLEFDPSRVKQVLINLLTNALKFTVSGSSRNVTLTLGGSHTKPTDTTSSVQFIPRSEGLAVVEESESSLLERGAPIYLIFEVKDTGQGLSEEEMKLLFQRFVQASSRTHVKYGGSGLGLFISRRLTEMQNGAIGVSSLPGVGSTFAFYIETHVPSPAALQIAVKDAEALAEVIKSPISPPGLSRAGSSRNVAWRQAPAGETSEVPQASRLIANGVLIVEDNLINQQITRRGLLDRGYTVDVANHGLEALEKLRLSERWEGSTPLALILMDMEMPIQDGLTCTREIRRLESEGKIKGGRIPIIAVSANARAEQIREARAAGCDDVLVKPYRMPELIEKMQVVARRVWSETRERDK
jgi:signal transduction histidine kinase/AmiR/NasT family two-component response regulator